MSEDTGCKPLSPLVHDLAKEEELSATLEVGHEILVQAQLLLADLGMGYTTTDVVALAGHLLAAYTAKSDYTQREEIVAGLDTEISDMSSSVAHLAQVVQNYA